MAEGREKSAWQRTSALMALTVNMQKTKGKPAQPSDFNPFAAHTAKQGVKLDANVLGSLAAGLPESPTTPREG
jgi:hypothetical protein